MQSIELERYDRQLREQEEMIHRLRRRLKSVSKQIIYDPQTNLFSRAFFEKRLEEEVLRSERYRHFLTVALIHVRVEDQGSTEQLNQTIRAFGHLVASGQNRRSDVLAHYSKRQIAVILPETDCHGAREVTDRYRHLWPDHTHMLRIGIIAFPEDASNLPQFVKRLEEYSEDFFRDTTLPLPS